MVLRSIMFHRGIIFYLIKITTKTQNQKKCTPTAFVHHQVLMFGMVYFKLFKVFVHMVLFVVTWWSFIISFGLARNTVQIIEYNSKYLERGHMVCKFP